MRVGIIIGSPEFDSRWRLETVEDKRTTILIFVEKGSFLCWQIVELSLERGMEKADSGRESLVTSIPVTSALVQSN